MGRAYFKSMRSYVLGLLLAVTSLAAADDGIRTFPCGGTNCAEYTVDAQSTADYELRLYKSEKWLDFVQIQSDNAPIPFTNLAKFHGKYYKYCKGFNQKRKSLGFSRKKQKLMFTRPLRFKITPNFDGNSNTEIVVSFLLPDAFQKMPPTPYSRFNAEVKSWATFVWVRGFDGEMTTDNINTALNQLDTDIDDDTRYQTAYYYVFLYNVSRDNANRFLDPYFEVGRKRKGS